METLPLPQDFYINTGLYIKYEIDDSSIFWFLDILRYKGPIDCYCHKCKMQSVFNEKENESSGKVKARFAMVGRLRQRESTNLLGLKGVPIKEKDYFESNEYFEKEFVCSRNSEHIMCFTLLLSKNNIQKIGQYPSLYDLNSNTFFEYKNILGSNFKELQSAVRLYSNGVGVGSYVYLRRIIENFVIEPAYKNAKLTDGWDDSVYQKMRFQDRVGILKEFLPEFISENSLLYSILSMGIHSLDDKSCLKHFPVLLECIENVLFEIKDDKDRKLKRESLKNSLSLIQQDILLIGK